MINLPKDERGGLVEIIIPDKVASVSDTTISSATSVNVVAGANTIETTALFQAVYVNVDADPTSSEFVCVVPAGATRHISARDKNGDNYTTVRFLEVTSGAAVYVSQF